MSDYERKEGEGALFKNDKKEPGSNQPDYTGALKVNGKDMRLAGWVSEAKSGRKYFSIKMSEFLEKKGDGERWDDRTLDDELPF